MKYFVIGDIHGCYYTLKELITSHWDKKEEKLVLLGDLVNKGKHTFAVLKYVMGLQKAYKDKVIVLKGNHDYLFQKNNQEKITLSTKQKFEIYGLDYRVVLDWMQSLPHYHQSKKLFFSHAGVSVDSNIPIDHNNLDLLFNKGPIKNIKKCQFLGHVVVDKPTFNKNSNAWYMDTGAGYGKKLSGIKVKSNAKVKEIISLDINTKDIVKRLDSTPIQS